MTDYISKIDLKNEIVKVTIESEESETIYRIRLNDFLLNGFSLNQKIDETKKEKLQQLHTYAYGYNRAIGKLAYQDKSEKEMRTFLASIKDLSEKAREEIINELKTLGYLSDEAVAENQIYNDQARLIGKKKTRYSLIKRGIDKEVINQYIDSIDADEENERAVKKGKIIASKQKNKSYKEKIHSIKQKLVEEGYENADEIISQINLEKDDEEEMSTLIALYDKIRKKYASKYEKDKLRNAIYRYLANKGFSTEMIKEVMASKEREYED